MKMDDIRFEQLNNKKVPFLNSEIKSSTNFFDKNSEKSINYEFDKDNQSQIKKITNKALNHKFVENNIKKPVKKHGIIFYSSIIIIFSIAVLVISIISTYSYRYSQINNAYNECIESVELLNSQNIIPESEKCDQFSSNVFTSAYWSNGINSEDLINSYNNTIKKNQEKLDQNQDSWNTIAKDIQNEFALLKNSGTTNLTLAQILPQDSLKLGNKIENGQIQLLSIQEKNKEITEEIVKILNDISNKIDLYSNDINLIDYSNFITEFINKDGESKISSYQELTKKYEEFNIYTQRELEKLKETNSQTALELEIKSYKDFSGEDFYQLYEAYNYKFVNDVVDEVVITGDEAADRYIEAKAIQRGYKKRFTAYENRLELIEGQRVMPEARESYERMKLAAQKDGIELTLVSGYRAPLTQKSIFNNRFGSLYSPEEIISGQADAQLENVLTTSSIPGYSKHHNGYTIDIGCQSRQLTFFKDTECFKWISDNNYLNAKKFGFIPSYPDGTISKQGPNPEEWEYVWVGADILKTDSQVQ